MEDKLSVEPPRGGTHDDHRHRTYAEESDRHGTEDGYPQVTPPEPEGFPDGDAGGDDEGHHGRADALKDSLDDGVLPKLLSVDGEDEDDEEAR